MHEKLKKEILYICNLMHNRGLVSGTDGNLSVRVSKDRFLITRSGINKGMVSSKDILLINTKGEVLSGGKDFKVSTEWRMHLKAYELRRDISSVIHAHPPCVVAYTISGKTFPANILPEVIMTMGHVPITEYSQPCSHLNADIVEKHISSCDVMILSRHGVLSVGESTISAYNKLEKLEHAALTGLYSSMLGKANPLPKSEVAKLIAAGKKSGYLKF